MKKNFTSTIIFILLCAGSNLFAQTPTMHFDYPADTCFAISDFPTVKKALDEFHRINFGYDFCDGPCPVNSNKSCLPKLTNSAQTVTKENDFICFKGWMRFKWKCAPIQDPGPDITISINEIGGIRPGAVIGGGSHDGGTGAPFGIKKSIATSTLKVFPNPSNGAGQFKIDIASEHSELEIEILNITGQVVMKNKYEDLNKALHQFPFELNNQEKGIYFISAKVNKELIQGVRLIVL